MNPQKLAQIGALKGLATAKAASARPAAPVKPSPVQIGFKGKPSQGNPKIGAGMGSRLGRLGR